MIYIIAPILLVFIWLALDRALFKKPEGGYYQKAYSCYGNCKDTGWTKRVRMSDIEYDGFVVAVFDGFEPCVMCNYKNKGIGKTYRITWGDIDLGFTQPMTMKITVPDRYVRGSIKGDSMRVETSDVQEFKNVKVAMELI